MKCKHGNYNGGQGNCGLCYDEFYKIKIKPKSVQHFDHLGEARNNFFLMSRKEQLVFFKEIGELLNYDVED